MSRYDFTTGGSRSKRSRENQDVKHNFHGERTIEQKQKAPGQIFNSTHISTLEGEMSIEVTYPTPHNQPKDYPFIF